MNIISKKHIALFFIILFYYSGFSQNLNNEKIDSIKKSSIDTKLGIEFLIHFSQKNKELNIDSNTNFLKKAIGIINNKPTDFQNIKLLFIKGNIYFLQKKYVKAIRNFKEISKTINNKKNYYLEQEILSTLGVIYQRLNYPNQAIFYYLKSLKIQDTQIQDTNKICDLYVLLGHANIGLRKFKKSLSYYEKSLQLAKEINDNDAITRSYINIGNLYLRKRDYKKAEELTKKSLEISLKNNYKEKISICYLNLAEMYFTTKKYEKAIEYYKKTIKSIKTKRLEFITPFCYKDLAKIYSIQNKPELKKDAVIKHYEQINKYDSGLRLAQALRALNAMFKKDNDYNFAHKYLIRNTELLDSILKAENNNRVLMIKSLHELEKEQIINQKKILKFKAAIIYGSIILLIVIIGIIILIITRKKIIAQSTQISKQNNNIQAQNEEIKNQNEILFKYKNKLEQKVLQRTEELEDSLIKAEESNRLKTNFLNNISHEIRTPMNAIIGFSQLIDVADNEQNKEYTKIINKQANHLMNYLGDIVELSKIQSDTEKLKTNNIYITKFVKRIKNKAKNIKEKLDANNIELKFADAEFNKNKIINTDEEKLFLIITQVLDNAFKFTTQGYIKLDFEYKNNELSIIIKDTGIGIKKDLLPHIFDTFRKIEDGEKIYRGTGMGLALVKATVELLNGKVTVESKLNKGSKFIITIPNI